MNPRTLEQQARARHLRREQTDAERRLWQSLRGGQIGALKFRRQHPIGPFIVDFCCLERGLIVEVDGAQHTKTAEQDAERTSFLEGAGYRVARFWNHEVLQHMESVLARIESVLAERDAWRWGRKIAR